MKAILAVALLAGCGGSYVEPIQLTNVQDACEDFDGMKAARGMYGYGPFEVYCKNGVTVVVPVQEKS